MPAAQKKSTSQKRKKTIAPKAQSKARTPKATKHGDANAARVQNLVIVFTALSLVFAIAAFVRYY